MTVITRKTLSRERLQMEREIQEIQELSEAKNQQDREFARVHKTLRITPAMAAGISDHVWRFEEIAALAE